MVTITLNNCLCDLRITRLRILVLGALLNLSSQLFSFFDTIYIHNMYLPLPLLFTAQTDLAYQRENVGHVQAQ